jgi:hypothetical protein
VSFKPENALEKSLVKAAGDPAFVPEFYRDFAQADIFILQRGKRAQEKAGQLTLKEGETIQIQNIEHNGKPHIPIFSSLSRLRSVLDSEVAYLGINALEFLKITKGSALLLNPGSDYGKEITAEEASSIIDGSVGRLSERYVAQKETQIMIGEPLNYPTELVEALSRLFRSRKQVRRAWLAHFFDPERDKRPHTLVAIETDHYEEIVGEIGTVATNVHLPDPPLDLTQITGRGGGIEDYFLKGGNPFYERRFMGLF